MNSRAMKLVKRSGQCSTNVKPRRINVTGIASLSAKATPRVLGMISVISSTASVKPTEKSASEPAQRDWNAVPAKVAPIVWANVLRMRIAAMGFSMSLRFQ